MAQEREEEQEKVLVNFYLYGPDAASFLRAKKARFVLATSEFARMLILERLSEVGAKVEKTEVA